MGQKPEYTVAENTFISIPSPASRERMWLTFSGRKRFHPNIRERQSRSVTNIQFTNTLVNRGSIQVGPRSFGSPAGIDWDYVAAISPPSEPRLLLSPLSELTDSITTTAKTIQNDAPLSFDDCADCLLRAATDEPNWIGKIVNVGSLEESYNLRRP